MALALMKKGLTHRLNMKLDHQSIFGFQVHRYPSAATPQLPSSPRIWAHIRGRYWSAKKDDIFLWTPPVSPYFGQIGPGLTQCATKCFSEKKHGLASDFLGQNISQDFRKNSVNYRVLKCMCALSVYSISSLALGKNQRKSKEMRKREIMDEQMLKRSPSSVRNMFIITRLNSPFKSCSR